MTPFNFTQIQTECPKAFERLMQWVSQKYGGVKVALRSDQVGWYGTDGVHPVGVWFPLSLIEINAFFDENGIYGFVNLFIDQDGEFAITYYIERDGFADIGSDGEEMLTRSSALQALWQKEFHILEGEITK